jgi:hypothetical protein
MNMNIAITILHCNDTTSTIISIIALTSAMTKIINFYWSITKVDGGKKLRRRKARGFNILAAQLIFRN